MAKKLLNAKELREQFKGTIIIESNGNFILPGFSDIATKRLSARKVERGAANSYTVELHLALMNRVDGGTGAYVIDQNEYHALDRVPKILSQSGPSPYNEPFLAPGETEFWFDVPFSVDDVPASTKLLDFIRDTVGADTSGSYITFNTDDISSSFLFNLNFGDIDGIHRFKHDDGQYWYDKETGEGGWDGWAWMYFIGTPEDPIEGQLQPSGSSGLPTTAYPGVGLADFDVGMLNATPNQGAFTLSYEKTQFVFSALTATENGESVHRLKVMVRK